MTDSPAATAPAPSAADVTPSGYLLPSLNLIAAAAPAISTLATESADVKTLATNLGIAGWLPWIGGTLMWIGVLASLNWFYRRGVGLQHKWALFIQKKMPWNR